MTIEDATKFRAMVARCNLLGSDRPDLQFVTEEAPRSMAKPHMGGMDKVTRMAKYMNGDCSRIVHDFPLGRDGGIIHARSASDWNGCLKLQE